MTKRVSSPLSGAVLSTARTGNPDHVSGFIVFQKCQAILKKECEVPVNQSLDEKILKCLGECF